MKLCLETILAQLAAPPGPEWTERAATHARACPRCAGLLPFLEPLPPEPALETVVPADLLRSVIAATSGAACSAAESRLTAGAILPQLSEPTLAAHIAHCAGCRAFAGALIALEATLPELAVLDPGPAFTAAVLRATTGAMATPAPTRGWRAFLAQLWIRPRFPLELAYAGALMLWLALGVSGLSVAEPVRWIAERPAEALRRVGEGVEALPARRELDASGEALAEALSRGDLRAGATAAGELATAFFRLPGRLLETTGEKTTSDEKPQGETE